MNRINFTRLLPLIILPFITGCHDYSGDISDGHVKEKADKIEYAAAFEKAFGIEPFRFAVRYGIDATARA